VAGWALWSGFFPGGWLDRLSYDFPFAFWKNTSVEEVVVVSMDEAAHRKLHQNPVGELWNRHLHVQLLERLASARLVVFDLLFDTSWTNAAVDQELVAAMKRHGHVLVAATHTSHQQAVKNAQSIIEISEPIYPIDLIRTNVLWGFVDVPKDPDLSLRRHPVVDSPTNLAWLAASLLGRAPREAAPRWINYYGPHSIVTRRYDQALDSNQLAADFFRDKVVFVGKGLVFSGNEDRFSTPFTLWTQQQMSGVEIQARIFANLVRRDWLQRLPAGIELSLLCLSGMIIGAGLSLCRPPWAFGIALGGMFVFTFLAIAILVSVERYWFPWMTVVGAQMPLGLMWAVLGNSIRLKKEKEQLASQLKSSQEKTLVQPEEERGQQSTSTLIPDFTLLKCIGQGAYGEVWLGRNIVGSYHAVKIVRRGSFGHHEPFEREFRGVERVMPISRNHPGWVPILHVGRSGRDDFFYYVMEAADHRKRGRQIDPNQYIPHTLAEEIRQDGRILPDRCVEIGLDLTTALAFLHQQGLIHRDIKPSNIIFVDGHPKFADIGLVTSMGIAGEEVSLLGTRGYIAPEGPGTATADVYSLGKVLYQAASGLDVGLFPELPSAVLAEADQPAFLELYELIARACANNPADRFYDAVQMHEALKKLR
jgi:CHASE2 domain-containing sensor protein